MKEKNTFPKMHISLYVADITKTVTFYTAFFNKEADKVKDDYAKFILNTPALIISFVQNPEKVKHNFGHLGIQVDTEEKVHLLMNSMKEKGFSIKEEMGTNCCYAKQDKFWIADPDGNQWEIYYFHEDVEFNDPHYSSEEQAVCCTPEAKKVKVEVQQNTCTPNSGCC